MSCGVCADEGHVGEGGLGAGGGVEVVDIVVRFDAAVSEVGVLECYKELSCATPSKVVVKAVIASARDEDVFEIDRTAEEFDAIVFVSVDLDVFDGGSRADGVKGDAVEFVVGADKPPCEFDTDIAQDAAAVVVVAAAVPARTTFSETLAGSEWTVGNTVVEGGVSVEDEATPVAWLALSLGFGGSEDNGFFACAFGKDLAVASDDQDAGGLLFADDGGSGIDAQVGGFDVITDVDESAQDPFDIGGEADIFGVGSCEDAGSGFFGRARSTSTITTDLSRAAIATGLAGATFFLDTSQTCATIFGGLAGLADTCNTSELISAIVAVFALGAFSADAKADACAIGVSTAVERFVEGLIVGVVALEFFFEVTSLQKEKEVSKYTLI